MRESKLGPLMAPKLHASVGDGELFGIEIEVENCRLPFQEEGIFGSFATKHDGSLRNGVEFVSPPWGFGKMCGEVTNFYRATKGHWSSGARCGIHIHTNVLGRTNIEVLKILQYYTLIEPVVFEFVGESREENIFCVPYYRAPQEVESAALALQGNARNLRYGCKYSALNTNPVGRLGTIEFRQAPTWENAGTLIEWLYMVRAIVNTYKLKPLHEELEHGSLDDIIAKIGVHASQHTRRRIKDLHTMEQALMLWPPDYTGVEWGAPSMFHVNPTQGDWPKNLPDITRLPPPQVLRRRQLNEPLPFDGMRNYNVRIDVNQIMREEEARRAAIQQRAIDMQNAALHQIREGEQF